MRWLILLVVGFTLFRQFQGHRPDPGSLPPMTLQYAPGSIPYLPGDPALIEFWATWCPPCRQAIPHLNNLQEACGDIDLQVIGVTDEDVATIEDFRRRNPIHYSIGIDTPGLLARHFGVHGIPQAVLVDGDGKVRWKGHPMELTEAVLRDFLP